MDGAAGDADGLHGGAMRPKARSLNSRRWPETEGSWEGENSLAPSMAQEELQSRRPLSRWFRFEIGGARDERSMDGADAHPTVARPTPSRHLDWELRSQHDQRRRRYSRQRFDRFPHKRFAFSSFSLS
ncbi:uncharacterized protein LOC122024179 [Zingiber officinale]|uniref:uncharacterized protein LOC122024179 n=1 Tax=Zingiber officinale TaxID=94328 RepID=UPI001C4B3E76|nr:uncharacterized protein LOC122024179 [Zingiber officinale]